MDIDKIKNFLCYFDLCALMIGDYGPTLQTLGIIVFVLFFNFIVKRVLLKLSTRFNNNGSVWSWSFATALPKPLSYFVWYAATVCSIDNIASSLSGFHLTNIALILILGSILAFCWFLLRWNHKLMHAMIEKSQSHQVPFDPGKIDLIGKVVTVVIIMITLFMVMDLTGYNMHTLITFGGIGGLAIAFASQQMISSFFGGMMIYITRPFTIGEKISLPSLKVEGYIEEIGWYTTRVRSLEKQPIYLPNSIFTQTVVVTPSRMSHERFHYTIGLRYQDVPLVTAIVDGIKKMLMHHSFIDQHLPIEVCLINFSPSSLDIDVSAFVSINFKTDFKNIRQDLLLKVYQVIVSQGAQLATNNSMTDYQNSLNGNNPVNFSRV